MEKNNIMDRIKEFWSQKSKPAKRNILTSGVILIVLIGALVYLYTREKYEFLLSTTDNASSASVINELKAQDIKYDVKGDSIYVTGVNPDALLLELAGSGYLDSKATSNLELFSKPLFISEKQEAKLIQKDLEGSIASAIKSYNEVADANVILTMGKESSFKNDSVPATAAIQLKLKSSLSSKQVKSIEEFVAAAVPNLSSTDVVITDTNNNLLSSGGSDNYIEDSTAYTQKIEDTIASQISELLVTAFPTTNFKVVSRVQVNFDETKIEKQTVESGPDTVISRETHSETKYENSNGGVVGTEENVPSYETPDDESNILSEVQDEIINYELNKTTEQITKRPEIQNVNVTVVADKTLSNEDTEKIKELVETASGYNEERGDKISVNGFNAEDIAEEQETFKTFVKDNFKTISNLAIMLLIIIAIILITLKLINSIFDKSQKKKDIEAQENVGDLISEGVEVVEDIDMSARQGTPESVKKKETLKKEIDENPQQIANVLKAWIDRGK